MSAHSPATRRQGAGVDVRAFAALERRIHACELCPRLRRYCERVAREKRRAYADQTYWGKPVAGFGDPAARLLIVGLAPGAHGSNRTGRMFTGDSSGDWLFAALQAHGFANRPESVTGGDGLALSDAFITAAARCAPPGNRPTPQELTRCQPYLEREIALLRNVRVVVALGSIGLRAYLEAAGWWRKLAPRERPRLSHGAEVALPDGRALITSYHPSRQNTQTGRLTRAMWNAIFERARALLADA
jgi:uracil-DNA glycosylase family 4